MRSRRLKTIKSDDTNRWMVSYADFITLLFAFFVVLYAVSSVNVEKYRKIASTMERVFSKPNKLSMANHKDNKLPSMKQKIKSAADTVFANGSSELEKNNPLGNVKDKLKRLDLKFFKVRSKKDWVELEIKSQALFKSGDATPNQYAVEQLKKLALIVKDKNHPVAVEGYTDNKPINTNRFPSNWELSAARAAAVARILVSTGVLPNRVSAIGFGEQFPVADNDSIEGRKKNRRVVLILAKNKAVQRLLNPKITEEVKKQARIDHLRKTTVEVPIVKEVKMPNGDIKFIRTTIRKNRNSINSEEQ